MVVLMRPDLLYQLSQSCWTFVVRGCFSPRLPLRSDKLLRRFYSVQPKPGNTETECATNYLQHAIVLDQNTCQYVSNYSMSILPCIHS
jgi:hypothetical protein